jgi:hypothetical protein
VRLRAHAIIEGRFVEAGTPIPDAELPKAFLKYREGGPPIAGLLELPPLEQNGRPPNSNGQWVAVEGADAETMSGHDLKNKRAYLHLNARMEVDPALREEHLASLRRCYQKRKARAGKKPARPAQTTLVEGADDSSLPSSQLLPLEMTGNGEAPVLGARYFQRGGRYVRANRVRPRPRELVFKWDGIDFVCCGTVPDSAPTSRLQVFASADGPPRENNPMTHSEFSRRGGSIKSPAKKAAVMRNLAKAQAVRKNRFALSAFS